jgi:hypothetical protein
MLKWMMVAAALLDLNVEVGCANRKIVVARKGDRKLAGLARSVESATGVSLNPLSS